METGHETPAPLPASLPGLSGPGRGHGAPAGLREPGPARLHGPHRERGHPAGRGGAAPAPGPAGDHLPPGGPVPFPRRKGAAGGRIPPAHARLVRGRGLRGPVPPAQTGTRLRAAGRPHGPGARGAGSPAGPAPGAGGRAGAHGNQPRDGPADAPRPGRAPGPDSPRHEPVGRAPPASPKREAGHADRAGPALPGPGRRARAAPGRGPGGAGRVRGPGHGYGPAPGPVHPAGGRGNAPGRAARRGRDRGRGVLRGPPRGRPGPRPAAGPGPPRDGLFRRGTGALFHRFPHHPRDQRHHSDSDHPEHPGAHGLLRALHGPRRAVAGPDQGPQHVVDPGPGRAPGGPAHRGGLRAGHPPVSQDSGTGGPGEPGGAGEPHGHDGGAGLQPGGP